MLLNLSQIEILRHFNIEQSEFGTDLQKHLRVGVAYTCRNTHPTKAGDCFSFDVAVDIDGKDYRNVGTVLEATDHDMPLLVLSELTAYLEHTVSLIKVHSAHSKVLGTHYLLSVTLQKCSRHVRLYCVLPLVQLMLEVMVICIEIVLHV